MIQELEKIEMDQQFKQDKKTLSDLFVCDFVEQDLNLYDTKQIEILTAFIRYYQKMKEIDKILLSNTIDPESFEFHSNQLRLHTKVHKKLVSIKLFLICNK